MNTTVGADPHLIFSWILKIFFSCFSITTQHLCSYAKRWANINYIDISVTFRIQKIRKIVYFLQSKNFVNLEFPRDII